MIKILKGNMLNVNDIEEVLGLVEGYALKEFSMVEDNAESIRQRAISKMLDHAKLIKADIIIDFEIISTHLYNGYYEVYCSGNAIRLKGNKFF